MGIIGIIGFVDNYLMIGNLLEKLGDHLNLPKSKCDNYLGQGLPFVT